MVFFLPYLSGGVCRAVSLLFSIAHPGERCKQKMEQSLRFFSAHFGVDSPALRCYFISVPKNGTDVNVQEYFL